MYPISASQIKAARALLDWSQGDLAVASNLSRTTIRSVEMGFAVRPGNINEIYKAFEKKGIEFLDDEGVKKQPEDMKAYRGPNSCDRFYEDLLNTVKEKGGDVVCHVQLQDMVSKPCGAAQRTNFEWLEEVQKVTDVKCLLASTMPQPFSLPSFQVRVIPDEQTPIPSSYIAYANQWVFIYQDSSMHFAFAVFRKPSFTHSCQNYFLPRWHVGKPLLVQASPQKRQA